MFAWAERDRPLRPLVATGARSGRGAPSSRALRPRSRATSTKPSADASPPKELSRCAGTAPRRSRWSSAAWRSDEQVLQPGRHRAGHLGRRPRGGPSPRRGGRGPQVPVGRRLLQRHRPAPPATGAHVLRRARPHADQPEPRPTGRPARPGMSRPGPAASSSSARSMDHRHSNTPNRAARLLGRGQQPPAREDGLAHALAGRVGVGRPALAPRSGPQPGGGPRQHLIQAQYPGPRAAASSSASGSPPAVGTPTPPASPPRRPRTPRRGPIQEEHGGRVGEDRRRQRGARRAARRRPLVFSGQPQRYRLVSDHPQPRAVERSQPSAPVAAAVLRSTPGPRATPARHEPEPAPR